MNKIFIGMLLIGIGGAALLGNMDQVTLAFVDSSKDAVQLCIVMLGIVGMWTGMMKIAEQAGLAKKLANALHPIIRFLYPKLTSEDSKKARYYIAENMAANFLGLGWAATPAALKAMDELVKVEQKRTGVEKVKIASDEMCTFLVINVSSLQLIPVTIIAYRSQYGAVNPANIIMPAMVATLVSTVVAVIYCKLANGGKKGKQRVKNK